ncbi:MAG TPA: DUF1616 domain-containing protein [Streptosporangiaceae bacterium]
MRRNTDLAVTAAGTIAAALVTGLVPSALVWLRVLAGVPLVLVLPGYALTAFALPARSPRQFSPVLWRTLWTTGLSLAVAVLGGLVLNLIPAGLTRVSWAVLLAVVTLAALAAAIWLRPSSAAAAPPSSARGARWRPSWVAAGYGLAALAMAGTATGLAVVSGGWEHSTPFAQLWLVPGQRTATLGVRSAYPGTQAFRLVLKDGTRQAGTWDFTLTTGQTWQRAVAQPAGQRITAQLNAIGNPVANPADQTKTETVAITSGDAR